MDWPAVIRPLDTGSLRMRFASARPFPFVAIDDFLDPAFAREVAGSFPRFEDTRRHGRTFRGVNEHLKVQTTTPSRFPPPIRRLSDALATKAFREAAAEISGIPNLLWDPGFHGGGMHQTAASGRLDVHVDFNRLDTPRIYRRLNLLIYLNERWSPAWGGQLELWNRNVSRCEQSFAPVLNRAILFETSDHSWHGVQPVRCPPGIQRIRGEPRTHAIGRGPRRSGPPAPVLRSGFPRRRHRR